jgi:hypothetical protein
MRERREKYFAYISTSLIAHDNFNYAAYMDKPTHRLMSKLFEEDLIDDTVIFFFSLVRSWNKIGSDKKHTFW